MDKKELGIIDSVRFGLVGGPAVHLALGINTLIGGAVVGLSVDDAIALLQKHYINDIKDLVGKPCVIYYDERRAIHFVELMD